MSALKTALFLFCSVSLSAQSSTPGLNDRTTEPTYAGPSVLSRGSSPGSTRLGAIHFRPFLGLNAIYDSGLNGTRLDPNNKIQAAAEKGVELAGGVTGSHAWRFTSISLSYQASARHYTPNSYYDGIDQSLSLLLQYRLARRLTMVVGVHAGTYSNRLGYISQRGYYDPLLPPTTGIGDLFDNRVIYAETTGRLIYQKSARMSFSLSGGGFLTRRRSTALYGDAGEAAGVDMNYRLSRYVTIGADYSFEHFSFFRIFGASDIHSGAGNLAVRLSRNWELSLRGGAFRSETLLFAVVRVDPVLAAITGQTSGVIAAYTVHYTPLISARLARFFRVGRCSTGLSRGTNPGNGVFLTSRQDEVDLGCSYTAQRYWSFGVNGQYNSLTSLAQNNLAPYRSYSAGGGVTRSVAGTGLYMVLRGDVVRDVTKYGAFVSSRHYRVSFGVSYSPGDFPLTLW